MHAACEKESTDVADGEDQPRSGSSNHLLARVPAAEFDALHRYLTPVTLDQGQILYEPGDRLEHVYLLTSGMISLVTVMKDGRTAETATVGREGAVAMSAGGYVDDAFVRFIVQIPGTALRTTAKGFEQMVDDSVRFCSAVSRWREVFARSALQAVACNAVHHVRERCARWIATTHDRTEANRLPLTQEFLAEMLGVKRNAISIVARELQAEGLIDYVRGRISVIDRPGLERAACECYGIIRGETAKLFADPLSDECDECDECDE